MSRMYFFSYDSLFRNGKPQPGAKDFMRFLVRNQLPFLILTDKSSMSRQRMAEKMYESGFPLLSEEMFFTTLMASIDAISHNYPEKTTAWYIGTDAMKETLEAGGFTIYDGQPAWVFVGTDRSATYRDYCEALRMVLHGATLVSLSDAVLEDTSRGKEIGCGSIVMMLEHTSGKEALTAGWSSPVLVKKACRYFEVSPEEVFFISDNLDVEIASANEAGVNTIFVMGHREIDLSNSEIKPTYIVDSLRGLFR